jgi:hypothetical protein
MSQRTATDTMENAWILEELDTVSLGDRRLEARLAKVLDRLASRPTVSIPAACRGWAETQAAYRFFANAAVTPESVLKPHRDATLQRIVQQPVVLLPQDTTELDFTSKKDKIKGLGPFNDDSRVGLFGHPVLAVTPERLCLGLVHVPWWMRPDLEQGAQRKHKAIEDKESVRWLEGYRQACAVAEAAPHTTVVSLSDREGDIYECFAASLPEAGRRKADWIVRVRHNRVVTVDGVKGPLWDRVAQSPVLGELRGEVPGKPDRKARQARLTVQSAPVRPRIPYRPQGKPAAVTFSAVLIREVDPPEDEEPLEWLLLTNLSASTFAEACRVVEYYLARWQIEVFFRVLKTGCHVDARQLETTDRLCPCLTLLMIVAWRVLFVTWMGRTYPHLSCEVLFTTEEWQSVWTIVKRQPLPQEPPTLAEFIGLVAGLGGHLGRKHDGEPGAQTLWLGMQRMHDFAHAWVIFGPNRKL